ncbi:hypothetical protein SAMN04487936_1022 [Halobacillus dabanensis]|uniref:Rhodanese domain-containing protein n=1 Tax=Halobacillus dabanensis TaxID=240302 RepID=A0A1I3QZL6_HALDA|nr:rhodanese-like domain-containing protein [Halobacillus dabanensis]SFJ38879.1 hypothetical protein SAMN04487936_1022 [Halobacillus dabanensis]
MGLIYGSVVILVLLIIHHYYEKMILKPYHQQFIPGSDFCIIDIRDYISAYRSPYPGAENIPLSYLPRFLKESFDCPKQVLLVTDDKRGAKLAAKMIRKKRHKSVYYIHSGRRPSSL